MNTQEFDILKTIYLHPGVTQRELAEESRHSLGIVNRSVKCLMENGYITSEYFVTEKAKDEISSKSPKRAIILAAGLGMRMVPINTITPKAFIRVYDEPLIERQIRQLHEVGVTEIYVIVGFMKEQFEYLIDDFGVDLIVNSEYAEKNNLHSLALAAEHLDNCYVIPSDLWCDRNPFSAQELYSWYMVSDLIDEESQVRANRKQELVRVTGEQSGNGMVGISYLTAEDAATIRKRLLAMDANTACDNFFWEEALYEQNKMMLPARIVHSSNVVEINTYEQLRELDAHSDNVRSDAIEIASNVLRVHSGDIVDITVLKKGMTNRSFLFSCNGTKYIMRIPGEGTDQLINRKEEASVYGVIQNQNLCDDILYINPETGYKITRYIQGARVCDPFNTNDVAKCMDLLKKFHGRGLKVEHDFDIFKKIDFYESLWEDKPSAYRDYVHTKENVVSLFPWIETHAGEKVLTHIDAVPDNFLFSTDEEGNESIHLIDWEYAGMQDPHVDLAMFCIYALYDRNHVDKLIDCYFEDKCPDETRTKIYAYIAACGLLWSNWCEYKRNLGVEFGEYSLRQYRYAKEYYRLAAKRIEGK